VNGYPNGSRDDYIYFLDISPNEPVTAYLAMPTNVPDDYRPVAGTLLEPQENVELGHTYSFLLQGDWSVEAIGDFPKTFNKLYSVIYGMNVLHTAGYTSHPWRGGFSSMHFFKEAMEDVPRKDRPYIEAMQKASPGFISFSLDARTADQVVQCIADFKEKEWAIVDASSTIRDFIRRHKLNEIEDQAPSIWVPFDRRLTALARNLLSYFEPIDESQFMTTCPRPFEAAKIALTFAKYVQDLVNFERQGLVEFRHSSLNTTTNRRPRDLDLRRIAANLLEFARQTHVGPPPMLARMEIHDPQAPISRRKI